MVGSHLLKDASVNLVVKPKWSIWRRLTVGVCSLAFGALLVLGSYYYGLLDGRGNLQQIQRESATYRAELERLTQYNAERIEALRTSHASDRAELARDKDALTRQYEQLSRALTQARQKLEIDNAAYSELKAAYESSTSQIHALREDLDFYRSIISPDDGRAGIRVQDLVIVPTATGPEFRYEVTLIQALKHDAEIEGEVALDIEGRQDGELATLSGATLGTQAEPVKFRYFQNVEGQWRLPEGFTPQRVRVTVIAAPDSALIAERWYPWPST
ncbi:MAG: hypothetical protein OEQ39_23490 [Gammaproteobacteria bacterium]|nr:hypothetical protein [Gammaproteobacteria bacterium]